MNAICLLQYFYLAVYRRAMLVTLATGLFALLGFGQHAHAEMVNLNTGSSTYTIPIVTPPGTNGMGPNLALTYSSDAQGGAALGDDWAGDGWRLTGLGFIERRGKNYSLSPTYTNDDTFVLNLGESGGKLVYTGKDPATTAVGNYYRTQIDNYMRIQRVGALLDSWVLTDKGGTRYYFGTTAASRHANPSNASQVFRYHLDKVEDTHGVFWTVSYANSLAGMYPQEIVYSQGPGLPCAITDATYFNYCRVVTFGRGARSDVQPSYHTGDRILSSQYLYTVQVRLGGRLVRRYDLSQTHATPTARGYAARMQLTSVTEVGADGATALPPTTFTYNVDANAANLAMTVTSVVGDPITNLGGPISNTATPSNCTFVLDVDGDNRPDVLVGTGGAYYFHRTAGDVFFNRFNIANPSFGPPLPSLCSVRTEQIYRRTSALRYFSVGTDGSINASWGGSKKVSAGETIHAVNDTMLIDIDGDDRIDILGYVDSQWYWWRNMSTPGVVTFAPRTAIVHTFPAAATLDAPRFWNHAHAVDFADINGDGLMDMVHSIKYIIEKNGLAYSHTYAAWWYPNLGNGAFDSARIFTVGPSFGNTFVIRAANDRNRLYFLDVNDDGLPDMAWVDEALIFSYYPNLGGGRFGAEQSVRNYNATKFTFPVACDANISLADLGAFRFVDMNGDGLSDILVGFSGYTLGGTTPYITGSAHINGANCFNASGYHYYPKRADGTFGPQVVLSGNPPKTLSRTNLLDVSDLNGDGFPDIVDGTASDYKVYRLNNTDAHQLFDTARNPLGGSSVFSYARLHSGNTNRWILDNLTQNDGLGLASLTSYSYRNGLYVGYPNNEFRGYAWAIAYDQPDNSGNRARTTTSFHQDDVRKGRINSETVETLFAAGNLKLHTKTANIWNTSSLIAGVWRVDLADKQINTYGGEVGIKVVRTSYNGYDAYGNVHQVRNAGTDIAARVTTTDFIYNTTAYIVNRPSRTESRIDLPTGTKISETWFSYDNLANGVAPTKGDLTLETKWLSGGVNTTLRHFYVDDLGRNFGNRIGSIDAKGNTCSATGYTTKTVFDSVYQTYPVSATNALCHATTSTYWGVNDATLAASSVPGAYPVPGALATVTDPNGARTDSYWDALGRAKAVVQPYDSAAAPTTLWRYSTGLAGGGSNYVTELRRTVAGNGTPVLEKLTRSDGFGRTIQTKELSKEGGWITLDTWYNARGVVEAASVPYITGDNTATPRNTAKPKSTSLYDPLLRPVRVTHPDGTFRTIAYDYWSVSNSDEKGYTTTRSYDALGRLIKVIEPGGAVTSYSYDTYDLIGNNTQTITDALGNVSQTVFDTLGRKTSHKDPDLGVWTYTYDANGNLATQTDAKGQTLWFVSYDKLNRILQKAYPDGASVVSSYDNCYNGCVGYLSRVVDPAGTSIFNYDLRGRISDQTRVIDGVWYSMLYTYDSLNRVVNMTYPDNEVVNHGYNAQGLLEKVRSVTYGVDYVTSLDYDAANKITSKIAGNGKITTYTYNPQTLRLATLSTPGLQGLSYSYDAVGNITGISDTVKVTNTQTFGYDSLHRLTSASSLSAPSFSRAYTYDAIGNMLTGEDRTFTYPAAGSPRPHAPLYNDISNYTYDNNGNLTSRTYAGSTRYFTWDYDNRMAQARQGDGTVIASFSYNYAGKRVKKVVNGNTILTPFPEYRVVNGAVTKFYFANGQRMAERDSTGVYYYHPDHLGSSNVVSNSAGTEVAYTLFYPYGDTRAETGSKTLAHKYTGQEKDDGTGLYYYGARYYDSQKFLHFLSPDSIIPDPANPQTLNRYAYVLSNPLKYIDPTGNNPKTFPFGTTYRNPVLAFPNGSTIDAGGRILLRGDPGYISGPVYSTPAGFSRTPMNLANLSCYPPCLADTPSSGPRSPDGYKIILSIGPVNFEWTNTAYGQIGLGASLGRSLKLRLSGEAYWIGNPIGDTPSPSTTAADINGVNGNYSRSFVSGSLGTDWNFSIGLGTAREPSASVSYSGVVCNNGNCPFSTSWRDYERPPLEIPVPSRVAPSVGRDDYDPNMCADDWAC